MLMTLDFSKAFLYGDMMREVFIELPDEDPRKHSYDCVGKLIKSMYGLRDAPQIWQKVVRSMLEARGFTALVGTQCTYVNKELNILVVAHVDDFLVLGTESQLNYFLQDLQSEYECSGQVLGYGEKCVQVLKFLGRTITLTADGIEWEGDRRHVGSFMEKLSEEFGPADKECEWRGAPTPGVKATEVPEREPLSAQKAKAYRGLAALANFMAQDRADISFAAKEVSKTMSAPAECDLVAMKRLGRYLSTHPRCVNMYGWQGVPTTIDAYCDSDWGGDLVTRRSTSGGCVFRGQHLLLHWARTQQVVSLSSAEAELHSLSKCASEGLAAAIMATEFGTTMKLRLHTDASAAKGIIMRLGCGKVKHLDVKSPC